jgi:DNA-binding CsgD family transcriptional regulator
LTAKEQAVLLRLAQRQSVREIANESFTSVNTVKTHIKNVYLKLGVNSRDEAVRRAHELGLLSSPIDQGGPDVLPSQDERRGRRVDLVTAEADASLDAIDEAFFRMGAVRDAASRIADFEYLFCNRAALALLSRRRDDVLGRRLLELFPSHRTNGLFDAYVEVVETGEPLRYEFAFDEGGVAGEFEVVVSRAGDGYVLAGHDISDRKRLDRELAALPGQQQTALTAVIEQAKGYVARASGTDPETAFHSILRYARNHNLTIHDVCQAVVSGKLPDVTETLGP